MIRRSRSQGAYSISVLAVCVALLTIAYLSLAAYSARAQDEVEARQAQASAYYAAESGMLLAEHHLTQKEASIPNSGLWLSGELPASLARFKVEVRAEDLSPQGFTLHSIGQASGERGTRYTSTIKARIKRSPQKKWVVEWREQQ